MFSKTLQFWLYTSVFLKNFAIMIFYQTIPFQVGHVLLPAHWDCCIQPKVEFFTMMWCGVMMLYAWCNVRRWIMMWWCIRMHHGFWNLPCFLLLAAANASAEWIILKVGQFSKRSLAGPDHLAADHYLSKSISAEVERSCGSHSIMGIVSVVPASYLYLTDIITQHNHMYYHRVYYIYMIIDNTINIFWFAGVLLEACCWMMTRN